MIPADLDPSTLELPPSEPWSIVLITGTELRHDRFALRLQVEFPELVIAWLKVDHVSAVTPPVAHVQTSKIQLLLGKVRRMTVRTLFTSVRNRIEARMKHRPISQREVEEKLFGEEIDRLWSHCILKPTVIHDLNAGETIAIVKSLNPYFILTFGELCGKALRDCARGLALNQHEGWCPDYRGRDSVDWALYHRDLSKVGSTVHILADGLNSGPILRRGTACLVTDDTPESCLGRSAALGTELMCETVRELIQTKKAYMFAQRPFAANNGTWRITDDIKTELKRLLSGDFIQNDIARRQTF